MEKENGFMLFRYNLLLSRPSLFFILHEPGSPAVILVIQASKNGKLSEASPKKMTQEKVVLEKSVINGKFRILSTEAVPKNFESLEK